MNDQHPQPKSDQRAPDYDLVVWDKNTNRKAKVGSAWDNPMPDGRNRISIILNPCVVLEQREGLSFALFVNDYNKNASRKDTFVPPSATGKVVTKTGREYPED